uniref:G_PROTEIN_RECEP_F1_2 domain-containing protein n=1 Tax=Meloidogyne hapla TaxID=6305 RepID=A0A1I8BLT0_MELHA
MNFGSICAYLTVWIRIKFVVGNFSDYQTHLLKCLFVLLLLELFGWTFNVGLRVLMGPVFGIVPGTFLNFVIINLATNIAYIAIALNFPVLYTFSKEHRTAINKHWSKIKFILGLSTVHATGQQPTNPVFVVPNALSRQRTSSQSLKPDGE